MEDMKNENIMPIKGVGRIGESTFKTVMKSQMNVDFGIKEIATQIATGIYQSEIAMKEVKELVIEARKSELERSSMQYVAIMAVETAHWIDEYSKHWDEGEKKNG